MTPEQTLRPGVTGAVFDATQRWTRLLLGLTSLAQDFSATTYDQVGTSPPGRPQVPGPIGLVPGALMGMALAAQDAGFEAVCAAEQRAANLLDRAARVPGVAPLLQSVTDFLTRWDDRYREQLAEHRELAAEYLATAGPTTLDQLLARIDIDSFVNRVNVEDVVDQVDLDAVIDKIDLEAVIDRIDLRAVVLETVSGMPMADLLRESTGAMAASTADVLRGQVTSATRLAGRPFRRASDAEA